MNRSVAILLLLPTLATCAMWFQPLSDNTPETSRESRTIMRNTNVNYTVSYVPLFSLLAGIIPRIMSRVRTPTTPRGINKPKLTAVEGTLASIPQPLPSTTTEQEDSDEEDDEDDSPELLDPDTESEELSEFNETNLCHDFQLVRRPYRNNPCFFYQCELIENSSPSCRSQISRDPDSPMIIDYTTVEKKSFLMRVSDCLAIRVYKCSPGYVYNKKRKECVYQGGLSGHADSCLMT